jgi:hypothetical protein
MENLRIGVVRGVKSSRNPLLGRFEKKGKEEVKV